AEAWRPRAAARWCATRSRISTSPRWMPAAIPSTRRACTCWRSAACGGWARSSTRGCRSRWSATWWSATRWPRRPGPGAERGRGVRAEPGRVRLRATACAALRSARLAARAVERQHPLGAVEPALELVHQMRVLGPGHLQGHHRLHAGVLPTAHVPQRLRHEEVVARHGHLRRGRLRVVLEHLAAQLDGRLVLPALRLDLAQSSDGMEGERVGRADGALEDRAGPQARPV